MGEGKVRFKEGGRSIDRRLYGVKVFFKLEVLRDLVEVRGNFWVIFVEVRFVGEVGRIVFLE